MTARTVTPPRKPRVRKPPRHYHGNDVKEFVRLFRPALVQAISDIETLDSGLAYLDEDTWLKLRNALSDVANRCDLIIARLDALKAEREKAIHNQRVLS